MVISRGLMSASMNTAVIFWLRWSISLWDMKRASPVTLRRRWARCSRMVALLVSGRNTSMRMKMGDEAQMDSYRDQRQPMTGTEKPPEKRAKGSCCQIVSISACNPKDVNIVSKTYVRSKQQRPRPSWRRESPSGCTCRRATRRPRPGTASRRSPEGSAGP